MKEDLTKKFKLPSYVKDKSFAEASKLIQNRFKDREDTISKNTLKTLLDRLKQAQEYVKSMEQKNDTNDFFFGGDPSTTNIIGSTGQGVMNGAQLGSLGGPWGTAIGGLLGGITGLASADKMNKKLEEQETNNALSKNMQFSNDFNFGGLIDPSGGENTGEKKGQQLEDQNRNAMSKNTQPDLDLGMYNKYFNVKNQGVNYVVTPTNTNPQNAQGFNEQIQYLQKLNPNAILDAQYQPFSNRMAYGGKTNDYPFGGLPNFDFSWLEELIKNKGITDDGGGALGSLNDQPSLSTPPIQDDDEKKGIFGWLNDNKGLGADLLRYSPAISNLVQLSNLKKPSPETRDKINQRFNPNYVDNSSIEKIVENEYSNVSNAIRDTSGGSTGTLRSNLLAASLNKNKALSDAYLKADSVNRQQDTIGQQFDLGINRFNIGQSNLEKDINAQNEAAYETNKSNLISAFGENLGGIGTELARDEMIKDILQYTRRGEFITDDMIDDINSNAYGGTLDDIFNMASNVYKRRMKSYGKNK